MNTYPFTCDNCGHKPTAQEVIDLGGDCAKCRDTIKAYSVDVAEVIIALEKDKATLRDALRDAIS